MSQQDESPYFKYVVDLLKLLLEKDGSDLFVTVGAAPAFKIHGEMTPVGSKPISQEQAEEIVSAVMNDKQRGEFRETKECNFALSLSGIGRFRMNAYVQRGSVGLVARVINIEIPTLEALGLPQTLNQIVMEKRGLVLMVGATGSGKSTTEPDRHGKARSGADGGRHRLGQIDQPGGHDRLPQPPLARPHHHH